MLEAIGAGVKRRVGPRDWADLWLESQEFQIVKEEIAASKKESLSRPEEVDPEGEKEYATPFMTQLRGAQASLCRLFMLSAPDSGLQSHLHGLLAQSRLR